MQISKGFENLHILGVKIQLLFRIIRAHLDDNAMRNNEEDGEALQHHQRLNKNSGIGRHKLQLRSI